MGQPRTDETALLRSEDNGQPPYLYPDYMATRLRAPKKPLIILPKTLSDTTGPTYGPKAVGELDSDLTRQHERSAATLVTIVPNLMTCRYIQGFQ